MGTVRTTTLAAALALCLTAAGCTREHPVLVERVDVGAWGSLSRAGLSESRADVEAALTTRLGPSGFRLIEGAGEDGPDGAVRLSLDVPVASADPPRVGVLLQLRRRAGAGTSRSEAEGVADAPPGEQGEVAVRAALGLAIERALHKARAQVLAADKPDDALVKDLASKDPVVRASAVRVLTDRRNPAVIQALLDQLGADDPDEVRRAIGALVEMKEKRAVPALIELGNTRDASFLREVIYALAGIGGEEAQAYLYTVAQGHDHPAIREAAQQALDELSRSEQKPDRGVSSREGEPARH